MFSSLSLQIGFRYLGSKRRNGFLAFVSLFALLGMILGVFSLIVVMSVMNGFDNELKSRVLKVVPHAFLSKPGGVDKWPELEQKVNQFEGVLGVAPYIKGKGLISFYGDIRGVEIQGIDPLFEPSVSVIDQSMVVGQLNQLEKGQYHIVLGRLLARYLEVTTGDKVTITLPQVSITPAGVFPRTKRFTVTGVFEAGAQVDEYLALIHVGDAQKLFRLNDRVHGLRLKYDDIYKAKRHNMAISRHLALDEPEGQFKLVDWSETQGNLFKAVKMEKTMVSILLSIIIVVAAFNIITSLIMMVAEKRSDIAVLRTMGLSRKGVIQIFMIQGTLLGILGIAVGGLFGIVTAHYLSEIVSFIESVLGVQIFDPRIYFVTYLPSVWKWQDTAIISALGFILSFLATIYPAYRASKVSPAEALRYDI